MRDRSILRMLLILGISLLPTLFIKRKHSKDWVLTFFIDSFIVTFLDRVAVRTKRIAYPVRQLPKIFETSIIYDYLLCPLACVWFNQATYKNSFREIIWKCVLFTMPMCILEYVLVKKTNLITYKKWSIFHSFTSLFAVKLLVRGIIEIIRMFSKSEEDEPQLFLKTGNPVIDEKRRRLTSHMK